MRSRFGYVSNSSSSSFVVISDSVYEKRNSDGVASSIESFEEMRLIFNFTDDSGWKGLFPNGELQFGWQYANYRGIESKWNWLVLQAAYASDDRYRKLLDEYVKSLCDGIRIDWKFVKECEEKMEARIDHQSIDPDRTFSAVETVGLDEFLTNRNCCIANGNDNYEDIPEERD